MHNTVPLIPVPPVVDQPEGPHRRWRAVVYYRTDGGTVDVHYDFEELARLHDRVERGPHWDTIERIETVRVNRAMPPDFTVEQAEKL